MELASILIASVFSAFSGFFGGGSELPQSHVHPPADNTRPAVGSMPPHVQLNRDSGQYERRESQNARPERGSGDSVTVTSDAIVEYQDDNTKIYVDTSYRYIISNGIPNHETGTFPNSGNPNTISEQNHQFRVTLTPEYNPTATEVRVPGVALNGLPFEPGTAERNGAWSYEAIQGTLDLGLDANNAHVQPTGTYHYHGIPTGLVALLDTTDADLVQVGWAADGAPMYYSKSGAYTPGYQLKSGTRDIGGTHDGTYTQDYEYVSSLGNLDECNGKTINGTYSYVLTDTFPFIPRCLHGTPDASFGKKGAPGVPSAHSPSGARDGLPGRNGADGQPGLDGANGASGQPGRDGHPPKRGNHPAHGHPHRDRPF